MLRRIADSTLYNIFQTKTLRKPNSVTVFLPQIEKWEVKVNQNIQVENILYTYTNGETHVCVTDFIMNIVDSVLYFGCVDYLQLYTLPIKTMEELITINMVIKYVVETIHGKYPMVFFHIQYNPRFYKEKSEGVLDTIKYCDIINQETLEANSDVFEFYNKAHEDKIPGDFNYLIPISDYKKRSLILTIVIESGYIETLETVAQDLVNRVNFTQPIMSNNESKEDKRYIFLKEQKADTKINTISRQKPTKIEKKKEFDNDKQKDKLGNKNNKGKIKIMSIWNFFFTPNREKKKAYTLKKLNSLLLGETIMFLKDEAIQKLIFGHVVAYSLEKKIQHTIYKKTSSLQQRIPVETNSAIDTYNDILTKNIQIFNFCETNYAYLTLNRLIYKQTISSPVITQPSHQNTFLGQTTITDDQKQIIKAKKQDSEMKLYLKKNLRPIGPYVSADIVIIPLTVKNHYDFYMTLSRDMVQMSSKCYIVDTVDFKYGNRKELFKAYNKWSTMILHRHYEKSVRKFFKCIYESIVGKLKNIITKRKNTLLEKKAAYLNLPEEYMHEEDLIKILLSNEKNKTNKKNSKNAESILNNIIEEKNENRQRDKENIEITNLLNNELTPMDSMSMCDRCCESDTNVDFDKAKEMITKEDDEEKIDITINGNSGTTDNTLSSDNGSDWVVLGKGSVSNHDIEFAYSHISTNTSSEEN